MTGSARPGYRHHDRVRVGIISPFWSPDTGAGRCALEMTGVLDACPSMDLVIGRDQIPPRSTGKRSLPSRFRRALRVFLEIRRRTPDVVIVNTTVQASVVIAARLAGTRVIWWCHESGLGLTGVVMRTRKAIYQALCHATVCVSPASFADGISGPVIPNIVVRPRGVESSTGSRVLLVFGTKSVLKGTDRLPDLMSPEEIDDARLRVVGDADSRDLKTLKATRGELQSLWGSRLDWLSGTDHPDAEYARASALLLPSRADTRPRVVEEALARGIPVVASRLPGLEAIAARVTRPGSLLLEDGDDWGPSVRRALDIGRSDQPYIRLVTVAEFSYLWGNAIRSVVSNRGRRHG